ncbi:PREDICTED: cysteine protease ATG4A isoform X1 [Crocodylus porosus]|uniref:Cysteine protease n=2 Tax=Crocodylus porosus TaxID=8502 RepID=A0A7M4ER36_CROPO|nr:PREDICTED: cysteine protease ATG4A isoform X1 [Crocodylus porosus]
MGGQAAPSWRRAPGKRSPPLGGGGGLQLPAGPAARLRPPVVSAAGAEENGGGARRRMESDFLEEFPETDEPVWILGKQHHLKADKSKLLLDISARLWFTYRRKFSPIGGTGPSSDAGWGCMLRCGQMMLAQALICRHLGRDWQWEKHRRQPEEYQKILQCFLDRKDCCYSIHQMAQMGVGEGKSIGEWFGPNTVAQVLKKLALFDEWNSLAVYVSMDNTVVIEDIKKMCRSPPQSSGAAYGSTHSHRSAFGRNKNTAGFCSGWKPLLLIIPLRLGINHINPIYIDAFKECFKMPQSLGALGGKPNNAYYFIGFLGNELIYLDPHTTQIFVDSEENGMVDDQSFHCQQAPHRMKIMNLDPSVALGFFCKEEKDFDNWCSLAQKEILKQQSLRMFELVQKHPPHWPPFIPPTKPEVTTTGAELIESTDKLFELEEEFEILSV